MFYRFQVIDNSCVGLDELSAKAWGTYFFSGGVDYVNFSKGYSSLVESIVGELPNGVLMLNFPVSVIRWQEHLHRHTESGVTNRYHKSGSSWEAPPTVVVCDNGRFYLADHVIVTCSLGCLKENFRSMFEPQLPDSMANVS